MIEFGIGHNGAPETPANTIHAFCQVVASQDWFGGLVPSPIDASRPSYAMTEGAIYIIGQAYIGGGSIIVRGRLMKLTNGQVADSIRVLADVFNWSPRQVRRLLSKLSEAGFIEFTDEPENGQRSKSLIVCFERITSELINQLRTSDRTSQVSLVREPASGPQSEPVNEPAKYELTNGKTYTNGALHQQQRTSERTGSRTSAEPEALCSNTHAHARISKTNNLRATEFSNTPLYSPTAEGRGSTASTGAAETRADQARDRAAARPGADATKKSNRGTRLPADWQLPEDWRQWALVNYPGVPADAVRFEADKFRDYWLSRTGQQAAKLDWQATWRNWLRTAFGHAGSSYRPPRSGYGQRPAPTPAPRYTTPNTSTIDSIRDPEFQAWAAEEFGGKS